MVITEEAITEAITEAAIQLGRTPSHAAPPRPRRRTLAIGAAIVVTVVALVPVVRSDGQTSSDQPHRPMSRSSDDAVRGLVARGVVPAASLDDGTQIVSPALAPAQRSQDDIVRQLVAHGLVPAATLDDGTQIVSPAFAP